MTSVDKIKKGKYYINQPTGTIILVEAFAMGVNDFKKNYITVQGKAFFEDGTRSEIASTPSEMMVLYQEMDEDEARRQIALYAL